MEAIQKRHLSPHWVGKEGEGDLADDAEDGPGDCCGILQAPACVIDIEEETVNPVSWDFSQRSHRNRNLTFRSGGCVVQA